MPPVLRNTGNPAVSRDWIGLDHDGLAWNVRPAAKPLILRQDWAPPVADSDRWRIVQRWGSRVSALGEAAGPLSGGLFVKWCGLRHPGEALRFAVTDSRSMAEWRTNICLAGLGIFVAECLAVGERRRFGCWTGGVLVFRAVTPPLTLAACLRAAPEAAARRLTAAAADLTARLHEHGFCHHDLHGDNVLVDQAGTPAERLLLVDLHEATRHRDLAAADWLADLARLNAYTPGSRACRLRFWARYAAARRLPRERFRGWLAEIERETRRLWDRHYRKRGESIELY